MRALLSMSRARDGMQRVCRVTSCYFHEHCACVWANIMADIERAPY